MGNKTKQIDVQKLNVKKVGREAQEDGLQLLVLVLRSYVTGLNDGKKNTYIQLRHLCSALFQNCDTTESVCCL